MRTTNRKGLTFLSVASLVLMGTISLQGAQDSELEAFLPRGAGRSLILQYCTRCHSPTRIKEAITQRRGNDVNFWEALVRQMILAWNAPIPDQDVQPLARYLAENFGLTGGEREALRSPTAPQSIDPYHELNAFLPQDEGKVLAMMYCTGCHSPRSIRQSLSQRAGQDRGFWEGLVWRMVTAWNAPIPEADIEPLVSYLSKHFGTSWSEGEGRDTGGR